MISKRDVLRELIEGKPIEEVRRFYDSIMDSDQAPQVAELMGLNEHEWRANCHGVGFATLAQWRRSGWPLVCPLCNTAVDPETDYWLAREHEGKWRLVHIRCLPQSPATSEVE